MHYLVKLVVKGSNATEALEQAVIDADTLVEYGDYDWYAVDGRWGKGKAYGVDSKKGQELLKEGMKFHRQEFDSGLAHIRYMLQHYSDDDIYNENWGEVDRDSLPKDVYYLSKYQFNIADGGRNGAFVYAMDGDLWGGMAQKDSDLEHILNKNNKPDKLWVVPIDFHN